MKLQNKNTSEPFFFYYSLLMLLIAIGGFGINGIVNSDKMPPSSLLLFSHASIMFLWYILVIVQTGLIKANRIVLHKKLGTYSALLASLLVITGMLTVLNAYPRDSQGVALFTYNFLVLIVFSILYSAAILKRKSPKYHKRLIILATLSTLHPALFRVSRIFEVEGGPLDLLIWVLLLIVIIVYDVRTLKKVHKSTIMGAISIISIIVTTLILINASAWNDLVKSILG